MNKYADNSRCREMRSCVAKKFYSTAQIAYNAMNKSGNHSYYKCLFCDGWHISSRLPRASEPQALAMGGTA